jgi:glycosyltransferase involved in cell wall biosynthesis
MTSNTAEMPLRVCYFGTYRANYSRNQILLKGLRSQGVEVYECHAKLWRGIEDRVEQASGGWFRPGFLFRIVRAYWQLLRAHGRIPTYDVMLIGYPGQFDTFLGKVLARRRGKPMALDLYMSLYLIAEERGLVEKSPITGRVIRKLESLGLHQPDLIISDTAAYVDYHCRTYGLTPDRFKLVPAGADNSFFYRRPGIQPPDDRFRLIYFGTFIQNHGVPTIIEAAKLIDDHSNIHIDLYGDGPERLVSENLAKELGLENVSFHGWTEKAELAEETARSHASLGAFGETKQSMMTVQNKIWEAMSVGRPVITGDSPTMRETFTDQEQVYLVNRNDPGALADGILKLASDPSLVQSMGEAAWQRAQDNNVESLGKLLVQVLQSLRK